MKMRLRLPAAPSFIGNAFPVAYSSCFHLTSFISGFITSNVFFEKIHLTIKAGLLFSFRLDPQYTSETFAAAVFRIHNDFKLKM
jgi:hypothetical protein